MEDKEYGNVYDIGLKEAYAKTISGEMKVTFMKVVKVATILMYVNQDAECMVWLQLVEWIKDPLMPGKEFIVKPYKLEKNFEIENKIKLGASLYVRNP